MSDETKSERKETILTNKWNQFASRKVFTSLKLE